MTAPLIPASEGKVEKLREVLRSAIHARRMVGPWHDIDLANAVMTYIAGCTDCGFNTCLCDDSPNAALYPDTSKEGAVDARQALLHAGMHESTDGDATLVPYGVALEAVQAALRASPPPVEAGMVLEPQPWAWGWYERGGTKRAHGYLPTVHYPSDPECEPFPLYRAAPKDMEEGR